MAAEQNTETILLVISHRILHDPRTQWTRFKQDWMSRYLGCSQCSRVKCAGLTPCMILLPSAGNYSGFAQGWSCAARH